LRQGIGDAVEAARSRAQRPPSRDLHQASHKDGVYSENVSVACNRTKLMLVGDGLTQDVPHGDVVGTAAGDGFMVRDMTVENCTGPRKKQAYRCGSWSWPGADLGLGPLGPWPQAWPKSPLISLLIFHGPATDITKWP
jgi:hypothetical protein